MQRALADIKGEDALYRRVFPAHFRRDGKLTRGAYMVSGYPAPEPSVDLARLTTVEECAERRTGCDVGELRAQAPMDLGFVVLHQPLDGNRAHCILTGENNREKRTALAEATRIRRYPPG